MLFDRDDILLTLKENRQQYKDAYLKLFLAQKKEALEQAQTAVDEGKNIRMPDSGQTVGLMLPNVYFVQNQIQIYDSAILMFEAAIEKEIDLDFEEYQEYALDRWSWKESFDIECYKRNIK